MYQEDELELLFYLTLLYTKYINQHALIKRIKDEIFCFVHLRWCHNGWTSNILSGGCTTIKILGFPSIMTPSKMGKTKKSHLLFSFLVRIVLLLHFTGGIYLSKMSLHHFIDFI